MEVTGQVQAGHSVKRRQIPEQQIRQLHRCEELKDCKI